jgi:mono/diheme cytochrome c family protein
MPISPAAAPRTPLALPAPPHSARGSASRRLARLVAALTTVAGLTAGLPAQAASDPAVLYHNYCSVCHGDRGDGRSRASGALSTPPRDFTAEAAKRELTRERIVLAITHGRPGTAMVAWRSQLSAADIDALADHLLSRFIRRDGAGVAAPSTAEPTTPAQAAGAISGAVSGAISGVRAHGGRESDTPATARPDPAAPFPDGLVGQLDAGRAHYLVNCTACHGTAGDGAGPRAYFINPKPRNFVEAAASGRYNRAVLYGAVSDGRVGTEMPAWRQVMTPQQIADVAEYVYQAFLRGGPPSR